MSNVVSNKLDFLLLTLIKEERCNIYVASDNVINIYFNEINVRLNTSIDEKSLIKIKERRCGFYLNNIDNINVILDFIVNKMNGVYIDKENKNSDINDLGKDLYDYLTGKINEIKITSIKNMLIIKNKDGSEIQMLKKNFLIFLENFIKRENEVGIFEICFFDKNGKSQPMYINKKYIDKNIVKELVNKYIIKKNTKVINVDGKINELIKLAGKDMSEEVFGLLKKIDCFDLNKKLDEIIGDEYKIIKPKKI